MRLSYTEYTIVLIVNLEIFNMKLSKETRDILGNFSDINPSVIMKEGSVIRTVTVSKTILAQAKISEKLPRNVPIYDLKQFLNYVSAFEDPDLEFSDTEISISNGRSVGKYRYASESNIAAAPSKDIVLPSVEVKFLLTSGIFASVQKAAAVLGLPEVILVGKNGKAYITANDSKNPTHSYEHHIGETEHKYNLVFKVDNLKLIPRDYDVEVSKKGISHFKSASGDIEYWIPVESTSTFE